MDARGFLSRRLPPGLSPVQAFANEGLEDRRAADIQGASSSSSCNISAVKSTFTRWMGFIIRPPVKNRVTLLALVRHACKGFGADGFLFLRHALHNCISSHVAFQSATIW
jgi:hypothetical protein